MYVYIHVYIYTHIHTHIHIYMYVYIYIHTYINTYVYILYIHIYIYTYIHMQTPERRPRIVFPRCDCLMVRLFQASPSMGDMSRPLNGQRESGWLVQSAYYPLIMTKIAIDNGHRNSGYTHQKG